MRREYGLPLLGAQPRFQALTEERQTLEIEPVSRSGDDMIGREIQDLSILPRNLQHGAVAPSLGPPHEMTDEGLHPPDNPVFQPPSTGGTQHGLHSFETNPLRQMVEQRRGRTTGP
jgi:hypothetical protein